MTCEKCLETVDALALDALPPLEAAEMDSHLASCAECTSRYRSALAVVNHLPMSVPLVKAPASLRAAVLELAAAANKKSEAASEPASSSRGPLALHANNHAATLPTASAAAVSSPELALENPGPVLLFLRRGRFLAAIAATFAGLAIIGLSAWTADLQSQIHDLKRQQVAAIAPRPAPSLPAVAVSDRNAETAALVLLSSPTTVRAPLGNPAATGPSGAVFWNHDQQRCVVLARQLAPASAGHEYRVWFRTADKGWDGGSLVPDADGNAETIVAMDHWKVEQGYTIAIVLQPIIDDGSRQPVLSGEIRTEAQ